MLGALTWEHRNHLLTKRIVSLSHGQSYRLSCQQQTLTSVISDTIALFASWISVALGGLKTPPRTIIYSEFTRQPLLGWSEGFTIYPQPSSFSFNSSPVSISRTKSRSHMFPAPASLFCNQDRGITHLTRRASMQFSHIKQGVAYRLRHFDTSSQRRLMLLATAIS